MRTLRRFLRRMSSWTQTRPDEERLRAEIEDHIALQTADNISGWFIAYRSAAPGGAEVRGGGSNEGRAIGIKEDCRLWKR